MTNIALNEQKKKRGERRKEKTWNGRYQNVNRVVLVHYFSFICVFVCTTKSTVKRDFT